MVNTKIQSPYENGSRPVTHGQLLLSCQACWYSLTAVHQAQVLMFGEDFKDPLRLLGVMSAQKGGESHGCSLTSRPHFTSYSCSPVPQVQMLHHALVINQACCRGNRGGETAGLGCLVNSCCSLDTVSSPWATFCRAKRKSSGTCAVPVPVIYKGT